VTASTGSVSIFFLNKTDLAYQVNFSMPFGPFSIPFAPSQNSLTNSTSGGVFSLTVTASVSDVDVFLRHGYSVDVTATTDTGSLSLESHGNEKLGSVSLSSSTGSVDAQVDSSTIKQLSLHTSTGSIDLESNHLGTNARMAPVTLSTNLGSITAGLNIPSGVAVSVSASTDVGSISHQLTGFSVSQDTSTSLKATSGEPNTAPSSFVITSTTNLGSQDLTITTSS